MTSESDSNLLKLLVVGEPRSGKTALVRRFINQSFVSSNVRTSTVGAVDVAVRTIDLPPDNYRHAEKTVKLQIWNAPGDVRYQHITAGYFEKVDGVLIVYDVSDPGSFNHVRAWYETVKKHQKNSQLTVFLVGNKLDMLPNVNSIATQLDGLRQHFHCPTIETSAKTGHNVDDLFEKVAALVDRRKADPSRFQLNNLFNHNKDHGDKETYSEDGNGAIYNEDDKASVGSKISAYFKGKFKRQRRRVKQKILQKVNATDTTNDPLYDAESDKYAEFNSRMSKMQGRIHLFFSSLDTAFRTGAELGRDFQFFTQQSSMGEVSDKSYELMDTFTDVMSDGQKISSTLLTELQPCLKSLAMPEVPKKGAPQESPELIPSIPHIRQRQEQRERALLDFDAYRRKLRNVSSKNEKDPKKIVEKLKKVEAKLLRAQDTFEVLNTSIIQEFISCQDERAKVMNAQFSLVLQTVMKLFLAFSKDLDRLVPLVEPEKKRQSGKMKFPPPAPPKRRPQDAASGQQRDSTASDFSSRAGASESVRSSVASAHGGESNDISERKGDAGGNELSFASKQIDALFGQDERMTQQRMWEEMKERFQGFSLAHPFAELHKRSKPPEVSTVGVEFPTRARKASQFVLPPQPPARAPPPPVAVAAVAAVTAANVPRSPDIVAHSIPPAMVVPTLKDLEDFRTNRLMSLPPQRVPPPVPATPSLEKDNPLLDGEEFDFNDPVYQAQNEATVLRVIALYDYRPQYEGDISFNAGDEVIVYQWTEDADRTIGWWRGYGNGQMGYFPSSYVYIPGADDHLQPCGQVVGSGILNSSVLDDGSVIPEGSENSDLYDNPLFSTRDAPGSNVFMPVPSTPPPPLPPPK